MSMLTSSVSPESQQTFSSFPFLQQNYMMVIRKNIVQHQQMKHILYECSTLSRMILIALPRSTLHFWKLFVFSTASQLSHFFASITETHAIGVNICAGTACKTSGFFLLELQTIRKRTVKS